MLPLRDSKSTETKCRKPRSWWRSGFFAFDFARLDAILSCVDILLDILSRPPVSYPITTAISMPRTSTRTEIGIRRLQTCTLSGLLNPAR
eukprot:1797246-Rhodomonas_salina.1